MNTERWTPIKGYAGLYEVSDHGRVRSLDHIIHAKDGRDMQYRGRVLRPGLSAMGRYAVQLSRNGVVRHHKIHRLVAFHFLPPYDGKRLHVNHIDDNPLNNHVDNLEWVTHAENMAHAARSNRWSAMNNVNYAHKLTKDDVAAIRELCAAGETQTAIASRFGVAQSVISKIKSGIIWRE